jgi:hypothetical protein
MGQLETTAGLALEVAQNCTVMNDQLRQEFQRHIAIQFLVAGQPDDPHSAPGECPS